MLGTEHAMACKMDVAALATRKVDAEAFTFECRGIQRFTDWLLACRTLKNYHLILKKAFKMIPLEKVPYKSLVSVKNNKPTSLNQNLDNFK